MTRDVGRGGGAAMIHATASVLKIPAEQMIVRGRVSLGDGRKVETRDVGRHRLFLTWPGLRAGLLLCALRRHEVEFLVLGSVAHVLRGDLSRTPHDLDIAPRQSDENLVRLSACLNQLEVCGDKPPLVPTHVVPATFRGPGNALPLRSLYGRIEVCLHIVAQDTYADLHPNAAAVEVEGCMVLVASLADLDRYDAARPPPPTGPA